MGTEVQCKMYLPEYYAMKDLNDSTHNGSLPSHHENKTFGQHCSIFSTRAAMDGYMGCDIEQLRQTILKHETIFRHQLQELHRLYMIQRDMMNEVRSKEPQKHLKPMGTSQSSLFHFPSEDNQKRWHGTSLPLVDFNHHMPSASGADIIQSPFSFVTAKIMQSGCDSNHNESRLKDHVSLEPKCKKLQRRLFDLELPAERYLNDGEEGQGSSEGSGVESHPPNCYCEGPCERKGNVPTPSGVYSSCNVDALSSNRRNRGFTDLNEPFPAKEASRSASVNILGNITFSKEEMQRHDKAANLCSGFHYLAKEFSQTPYKEKDRGGSLCNLHLEKDRRQKGWLPYSFNNGQNTSNRGSVGGGFWHECLETLCESSEVGCGNALEPLQNKAKKTIFGVEISERNHDASDMASDTPLLQSPCPRPNRGSEPSSVASLKMLPASLRHNLISVQGNPCSNTFPQSNKSSVTLTHVPEVIRDRSLINSNVRSVSSSIADPSYQNGFCLVSQLESKESQVCHASNNFGYRNGVSDCNSASEQVPQHGPANNFRRSTWLANTRSADLNVDTVPQKPFPNTVISDSKLGSVDGHRKEENPPGGLCWLRAISPYNGKFSNESDGSRQMHLGSLQNCSQQIVSRAETMKCPSQSFFQDSSSVTYVSDAKDKRSDSGGSSNRKILGVPIFDVHTSKDLPSASSSSKLSCCASKINGANSIKVGLLHTDLNDDPMPSEFEETPNAESLVVEKTLDDFSANNRHPIDLNVSVTEEEAQPTYFSPRSKVKIAVEIDLEAPVVVETEMENSSGGEFVVSKPKEPLDSSKDESRDIDEGFMRIASEALVAISASSVHSFVDNVTHHKMEASLSDSLQWLAEIISSCEGDIENDVRSVSAGTNSVHCEESIQNEIDYFEYMTLTLTELKAEEYSYKPQALENTKDQITMPRRSRRGQARRGRQRKDFQRDVLPSLTSLSRNDVTEDLQMIEGLVRATGGTWHAGLLQRNSQKSKGGRGRKRSGSSTTSPAVTAVSPPETLQPKCGELGLEETRLTAWGKRTRRPPRQRCPLNHPPLPIQ